MLIRIVQDNYYEYLDLFKSVVSKYYQSTCDMIGFDGTLDQLCDQIHTEIADDSNTFWYEENCGFVLCFWNEAVDDEETNFKTPSSLYVKFYTMIEDLSWMEPVIEHIENEMKNYDVEVIKIEIEYDWKSIRRFLTRELGFKPDHLLFAKDLTYEQ